MSEDDRDPLLEVTTSRWHRRSSVICLLVFLTGLVCLVTALLVGYFGFVKSDAVGKVLYHLLLLSLESLFQNENKDGQYIALLFYTFSTESNVTEHMGHASISRQL